MALPTDSVAPDTPTSSSTWAGAVTLWSWFGKITSWIKGLSPTGSSKYDTGWVACDYTDTSKIDTYTSGQKVNVRRIGKMVFLDGTAKAVVAGILSNLSNTTFSNVPAEFRPVRQVTIVCQGSGYERWFLTIDTNGNVNAGRYSGTQSAGAWLPFNASWCVN